MKKVQILFFSLLSLLVIASCSGSKDAAKHDHEGETAHVHEGEGEAGHTHEGEAGHAHEAEAGHNHEGEEGHTHEGEEGHNHEGEAGHDHGTEAAAEPAAQDANLITFPEVQAKMMKDFSVVKIVPQSFSEVIVAGGQIASAQGDEANIVATTNGVVSFGSKRVVSGASVSKGESLLSIASDNLSSDNQTALVQDAKSTLTKAEADYKRAESLVKDKIISTKDFQQAELDYKQAKSAYERLSKNFSQAGKQVTAPIGGFLKNIYVKEGDYVTAGQPLATVSQNRRLVLQADVSQKHFGSLKKVTSANFKTSYDNQTYDLATLGGRLVSTGKATDNSKFFVPVYFEFDNKGDVVSGSYVEVYLKTTPIKEAIVVPLTALTEEQGVYYIYVQNCEDTYRKRAVKTGHSDGKNIQILNGLQAGETVVAQGAHYVKLASMSGAAPAAHNHAH